MALGATICKLELSVADMDRHYYANHSLTLAQHPSEKAERLLLRVVAFAMFAHEYLEFGRGVSTEDEPDLWQRDLTGAIEQWIDLGTPDDKRIRKACGRSRQVAILAHGGSRAEVWYERERDQLARFDNLKVWAIDQAQSSGLADLAARNMRLDASLQDGQVLIASDQTSVAIEPRVLKP